MQKYIHPDFATPQEGNDTNSPYSYLASPSTRGILRHLPNFFISLCSGSHSLRARLSSPGSNTDVASRGLGEVQNNKKLPPVRKGVIYFLRFLNSSDVRPTSEIIFFSTPGDISRPGYFGTGKMIPSFIKITCDHFCLSIT